MSTPVKFRLNGKEVEAPAGSTILEVAQQEEVHIPTLCHSPLLRPLENCRLCVVQVAGESRYKAACSTTVAEGMDVTTRTEELTKTRKFLLELLLDTHYGDCVAPCTLNCPADVDIQGYLALIRNGEYRDAVRLIKEKIPMPAVIGRVCPHFCEDACRRHLVDEPVHINPCKRFASDFERISGQRILPAVPHSSGRRVAIIGGGPAGLSAAYYLRSLGHETVIFEAREKLGGMLRYGIPEYRLPKHVLDWEIEGILSLGVEVKTGVRWGMDFTLDKLKSDGFDAVFLAIGAWSTRKLGIIGEDLSGVIRGIDFLEETSKDSGRVSIAGKRVVVIGGGNVAIDAARSSIRLGADKVTILYRRSRNEMPAAREEVEAAEEEGVEIQYLAAPTQLIGQNGIVREIEFLRMELGEPDASGRRRPIPIEGSDMRIEIDRVISAIGQYSEIPIDESDTTLSKLLLTRWGTIGGDPRSMHTGNELVFVGGDLFRGPATVVAALADGRKAAYSLERCFREGAVEPEPLQFNIGKGDLKTIDRGPFSAFKHASREPMPHIAVPTRINDFQEVELGFSEEQAKREARRCLECGCSAAFDCRLRDMLYEFQVDWRNQPSKKISYQRVAAVDVHPEICLDPNKCIRCERCYVACQTFQCSDAIDFKNWPRFNEKCVHCGLCVDLCPTGALMVRQEGRPVKRLDWRTLKTHCIHCGCGCQLDLKLAGERMIWISDGTYAPPGWASTCRRGRFRTYDSVWHGDRILKPLVRKGDNMEEASWRVAVEALLEGFGRIARNHGPSALGAIASPTATNEALYLLQKWFREGLGSSMLDFPGREGLEKICTITEPYLAGRELGRELEGLDRAGAIFVCGDDIEEVAPVVGTMIRKAAVRRNVPVFQLSSRSDTLTPHMHTSIIAQASAWEHILIGLAHSRRELGGETSRIDPSRFGLSEMHWKELGRAIAGAGSVAYIISELVPAETAQALLELAKSFGHFGGSSRAKIHTLSSAINAHGALLMGVSPTRAPGFAPVSDTATRKTWQNMEEAIEKQLIKGLFVQNGSALLENDPKWADLLGKVEFLALQESVPSAAANKAHIVLPTAVFAEQEGTVVNHEGRLLFLQQAFAPTAQSLADWEVLAKIMTAQGLAIAGDLAAIQNEIAAAVPLMRRWA